jgi:hypothetical protein
MVIDIARRAKSLSIRTRACPFLLLAAVLCSRLHGGARMKTAPVSPEVRMVRRGRLRLIPVRELEKWLEREAAPTLELK